MPTLATRDSCTGCMACMNACPKSAISFKPDNEGFLQPFVVQNKCVECGLCERSCPEVQNKFHKNSTGEIDVYAGWSNTDRRLSSSGGPFSSIARFIINQGGSVYGATLDKNMVCLHTVANTVEELNVIRGSKYIQSSIGLVFQQIKKQLKNGKYVLFTGTPCQVAGLYSYLGKDYDCLITIDLVCHGVPSNKLFKSYINKLEQRLWKGKGNEITNFEFRLRDGWGETSRISTSQSQTKNLYGINALYMSAFDKSSIFRRSCYECHYATPNRTGDFTIGDFWGIGQQGLPFKYDTSKGVSLLIVNSNKGRLIMKQLSEDDFYIKRTLEEAVARNHNISKISVKPANREFVIKAFLDDGITLDKIERNYYLIDKSLRTRISETSQRLGIYPIIKKLYDLIKAK